MDNQKLKTSEEWQKESNIIVLDPDGWDRKNYQYSWHEELINKKEFEKRVITSTIESLAPYMNGTFWKK